MVKGIIFIQAATGHLVTLAVTFHLLFNYFSLNNVSETILALIYSTYYHGWVLPWIFLHYVTDRWRTVSGILTEMILIPQICYDCYYAIL